MMILSSVAVHADSGVCPICNGQKTSRARTCIKCRQKYAKVATNAADLALEAVEKTKNGHETAAALGIERQIVWGPVLAQVAVNKDASVRTPGNGIEPYLEMRKPLNGGGYVQVFLFGAVKEDAGKAVTAMVELKTKKVEGFIDGKKTTALVFYIRAQKVAGVIADHKLVIGEGPFTDSLPTQSIKSSVPTNDGDGRVITVDIGFKPVVKLGLAMQNT